MIHIAKGGEFQEIVWYGMNQIQVLQDVVQCHLLEKLGTQGIWKNPRARAAIKRF
jgi:hypothetical protein